MILHVREDSNKEETQVKPRQTAYINFDKFCTERFRAQGELVIHNGWACLDYDSQGFLVGIELHAGDPFNGQVSPPDYLQPKNPLLA